MASSTAKMRAEVMGLTNVDGKGGVDIMADEETFRSTYDIMNDIAQVWGKMSDINRSALLEKLAGKVRSNQAAALLENFETARNALETAQQSEGTMNRVHQRWLDSVEARKAQFEAAQETASMTAMPANTLKGLYQAGTTGMNLLNSLMGNILGLGVGSGSHGVAAGIMGAASMLRSGNGDIWAGIGNAFNRHKGGRGQADIIAAYNRAYLDDTNPLTHNNKEASLAAAQANGRTANKYTQQLIKQAEGTVDATKATSGLISSLKSFTKNAIGGIATFAAINAGVAMLNASMDWLSENVINRSEHLDAVASASYAQYEEAKRNADAVVAERDTVVQQVQELEKKQAEGTITSQETSQLAQLESQLRELEHRVAAAEQQQIQSGENTFQKWMEKREARGQNAMTLSFAHAQLSGLAKSPEQTQGILGDSTKPVAQKALELFVLGSTQSYHSLGEAATSILGSAWEGLSSQAVGLWTGINPAHSMRALYSEEADNAGAVRSRANQLLQAYGGDKGNLTQDGAQAIASMYQNMLGFQKMAKGFDNQKLSSSDIMQGYQFAQQQYQTIESQLNNAVATYGETVYKALGGEAAFEDIFSNWSHIQMRASNAMYGADQEVRDYFPMYADLVRSGVSSSAYDNVMAAAIRESLAMREVLAGEGEDTSLKKFDFLNSLLREAGFEDAMDSMHDMASQGQDAAGITDQITKKFGALGVLLEGLRIPMGDLASLTIASVEAAKQAPDETTVGGAIADSRTSSQGNINALLSAQQAAAKIWKDSGFTGALDTTSKDFTELMAMDGGAYQAALERANGGLFFSKDAFDRIVQQKYREELSALQQDVLKTQQKYTEAAQKVVEEMKTGTVSQESYEAMLGYGTQLTEYANRMAQINYGMSDMANWLSNKGGAESGDAYDELGEAINAITGGKSSGLTGTREFAAAMRFLTGKEIGSGAGQMMMGDLSAKDWSYMQALGAVDKNGKPDQAARRNALASFQKDMIDAGILDKSGAVIGEGVTTGRMADMFNEKYGTHFGADFMQSILMGINDYIQDPAKKYDIDGYNETPESKREAEARKNFQDAVDAWRSAPADATQEQKNALLESVKQASAALTQAQLENLVANGSTEQAQQAAAVLADQNAEPPVDPMVAAIDALTTTLGTLNQTMQDQLQQQEETTPETETAQPEETTPAPEQQAPVAPPPAQVVPEEVPVAVAAAPAAPAGGGEQTATLDATIIHVEPQTLGLDTDVIQVQTTSLPVEQQTMPVETTTQLAEVKTMPVESTTQTAETKTMPVEDVTQTAETKTMPVAEVVQSAETKTMPVADVTQSAESKTMPVAEVTQSVETKTMPVAEVTQSAESKTMPVADVTQSAEQKTMPVETTTQMVEVKTMPVEDVVLPVEQTPLKPDSDTVPVVGTVSPDPKTVTVNPASVDLDMSALQGLGGGSAGSVDTEAAKAELAAIRENRETDRTLTALDNKIAQYEAALASGSSPEGLAATRAMLDLTRKARAKYTGEDYQSTMSTEQLDEAISSLEEYIATGAATSSDLINLEQMRLERNLRNTQNLIDQATTTKETETATKGGDTPERPKDRDIRRGMPLGPNADGTNALRTQLDELNAQIDKFSTAPGTDVTREDFTEEQQAMVDALWDLTGYDNQTDAATLGERLEAATQLFQQLQASVSQNQQSGESVDEMTVESDNTTVESAQQSGGQAEEPYNAPQLPDLSTQFAQQVGQADSLIDDLKAAGHLPHWQDYEQLQQYKDKISRGEIITEEDLAGIANVIDHMQSRLGTRETGVIEEAEIETKNTEIESKRNTSVNTGTTSSAQAPILATPEAQAQSTLTRLEDMVRTGTDAKGQTLSQNQLGVINKAIGQLEQALADGGTQALQDALTTAQKAEPQTQTGQAVTYGETPPVGGGTVEPIVIPVETEEPPPVVPPEEPTVTVHTNVEQPGSIDVPPAPTVTIPVQYGDPGELSVGGEGSGGKDAVRTVNAAAGGTDDAAGGMTLVDEIGAELIEHRSRGTYELGTNNGARFTRLDAGDIVHTAKETKKILRRGRAMANGGVVTGRAAANDGDTAGRKYTFTGTTSNNSGATTSNGSRMTGGSDQSAAIAKAQRDAASAQEAAEAALNSSDRKAKALLEWIKKVLDWIPTYLNELKKKTTQFVGAADDAVHYLSQNKLLDSAIENIAEEIQANISSVVRYRSFLREMQTTGGLSDEIVAKIQNGTIDLEAYNNEETVKAIQAYQQYWEKLVACQEALATLNDQMEALSQQKLDNVVSYFDRIDGLLRDQQKRFEGLIDLKKQYGQELTGADYMDSLTNMEQILANAQNEEQALLKELEDQLGVGGDMVQAILNGGKDVWEAIAVHVKKGVDEGVADLQEAIDENLVYRTVTHYNTGIGTEKLGSMTGIAATSATSEITELSLADVQKIATGAMNINLDQVPAAQRAAIQAAIKGTTSTFSGATNKNARVQAILDQIQASKQQYSSKQANQQALPPVEISLVDVPVTPATDEDMIAIGEMLGMNVADGSEEALKNLEAIKSLFTTSWDNPLAIGSDTWYSYMSTLENLKESITQTKIEISEMNDTIADIPLTNLKTGYDYLEEIQRNLEGMNSLLDAQGSDKYAETYRSMISVGMKQIENLQEQNRLIEEQMSTLDPLSEKYQELRGDLTGNRDTIADIRKNQEEWNDAIIDLQIERLKKQNDSYKEQLRLMQALDDLDKARQRRLLIYHEDTGFQYEADEDELESAQEAANDAIFSSIVSDLEKSKADSNIYGPLGERLISGSSILDSLGNVLVPVEDKLSGLDFEPYYQSIVSGSEQSGLLEGLLQSIDLSKLLEASIGGSVNIDIGTMTLNEVQNAKDLGDAIINQLPSYLLQALYQKGAK